MTAQCAIKHDIESKIYALKMYAKNRTENNRNT